jgi:hypothetical protein
MGMLNYIGLLLGRATRATFLAMSEEKNDERLKRRWDCLKLGLMKLSSGGREQALFQTISHWKRQSARRPYFILLYAPVAANQQNNNPHCG